MSLQDKQQFLSKEIIEQGYDAGEFSNFISSIRGEEEVDLDSWTLDEWTKSGKPRKPRKSKSRKSGIS